MSVKQLVSVANGPGEAERLLHGGVPLGHGVGERRAPPAVACVGATAGGNDVADEVRVAFSGGEMQRRAAVVGGAVDARASRDDCLQKTGVSG
jgi:hypothetical protein